MTSAEDVARVARGLARAQREAVKEGYIGDQAIVTVRSLKTKGLFQLVIDSPNGKCGFMRLTGLGLAVRALLEKEHRDA